MSLVYTTEKIFKEESEGGVLLQGGAYYIGPYQRGYKWKSESRNGQVPTLLVDLYKAFKQNPDAEYYLQYITIVKRKDSNDWEVIDGQQRLTTLTLLFMAFSSFPDTTTLNIAKRDDSYLVVYSRYQDGNIFENVKEWTENSSDEYHCHQDSYYLYRAYDTILKFLNMLKEEERCLFHKYVGDKVVLIINKEAETTKAEEVFANLNGIKVNLTDAELIKGLLLTKVTRKDAEKRQSFREIIDERTIKGRIWDEITSWITAPEIFGYFFKGEKQPMASFLQCVYEHYRLVYKEKNGELPLIIDFLKRFKDTGQNQDYELFNKYNELVTGIEVAERLLSLIEKDYQRMRTWYYGDYFLYNLLGYSFEYGPPSHLVKCLVTSTNEEVRTLTKNVISDICEKIDLGEVTYKSGAGSNLRKVLLLLNVFPMSNEGNTPAGLRFNFFAYRNVSWNHEHIFPHNPLKGNDEENLVKIRNEWDRFIALINCYPDKKERLKQESDFRKENDEAVRLVKNLVEEIFDIDDKKMNGLGNMTLLSEPVNKAIGNKFFYEKRVAIQERINRGEFLPVHSMDVFSKMLIPIEKDDSAFDDNIFIWSTDDIEAHQKWIERRWDSIKGLMK